jgi:manganese transport protein
VPPHSSKAVQDTPASNPENPYIVTDAQIKDPPPGWAARQMKHLGPGLILTASIVGSGGLVATTLLGAKAGFVCF